jgi:hypothetical protein
MTAARYEITVEGQLDHSRWSRWFEGMDLRLTGDGNTVVYGTVVDQAALHGLLAKVRDLGLALICVQRTPPPANMAQLDSDKE